MTRTILGVLAIPILLAIVGCEPVETDEERNRREFRENYEANQAEWEKVAEESIALTEKLQEEITYEEAVELFGAEGNLRMSATVANGERKIFEWVLDGGVRAELTFDDDALTEWSVK